MPAVTPALPAPRRIDFREVSQWISQKIFGFPTTDPYYADNTPVSVGCRVAAYAMQPLALYLFLRASVARICLCAPLLSHVFR
jgi:hypothetical protein